MKRLFSIFCFLAIYYLLLSTVSAQQRVFVKTLRGNNSDVGYSLIQSLDGGYVVIGYTNSSGVGGDYDLLLSKDRSQNNCNTESCNFNCKFKIADSRFQIKDSRFQIQD